MNNRARLKLRAQGTPIYIMQLMRLYILARKLNPTWVCACCTIDFCFCLFAFCFRSSFSQLIVSIAYFYDTYICCICCIFFICTYLSVIEYGFSQIV